MNQYLWDNGEKEPQYDNKNNGVEAGLIAYLKEIEKHGILNIIQNRTWATPILP